MGQRWAWGGYGGYWRVWEGMPVVLEVVVEERGPTALVPPVGVPMLD